MCCSSIMSNNPPPGHGGEGPTLGHFHFFHFFFQKCGGMWFYKEIGGMFLCKNTNRRPFGSRKCLNWWIRLKPRGGALIARGLCFYKETYPLFLCKITYRRIFEKKKWEKWKCPRVGPSPPCPGGGVVRHYVPFNSAVRHPPVWQGPGAITWNSPVQGHHFMIIPAPGISHYMLIPAPRPHVCDKIKYYHMW